MKVLHLIDTLSAGGAELHLLTLCRHLSYKTLRSWWHVCVSRVKDSHSLCVRSSESCIQNGLISGTPTCRVPILPVGLRGFLILT
jgi:hypothetical protein